MFSKIATMTQKRSVDLKTVGGSQCIFSVEYEKAIIIDVMEYFLQLKIIDVAIGNFGVNLLTIILSVGKDAERMI